MTTMITHAPTAEIRSVGIAFTDDVLFLLDAIAVEAADDAGTPLSRSEVVRRLVLMGLDLVLLEDPVLARYCTPALNAIQTD